MGSVIAIQKTIPSNLSELESVLLDVEAFLAQEGVAYDRAADVIIALSEAITNAIVHGNREDPSKRVFIRVERVPGGILASVRDEGEGFYRASVPDPLARDAMMNASGRGLLIMEALADEISYQDAGREVRLFFRIPKEQVESA